MKRLVLTSIVAFLFIGCGSSSTTVESDDVVKTDEGGGVIKTSVPSGFTGTVLDEYLFPSSSADVTARIYKNSVFQGEESFSYASGTGSITQRSLINQDGQVVYSKTPDGDISVTLYHDSTFDYFSISNFININDTVTVDNSSCTFTAHHSTLFFADINYADVIQISCPASIGYYQRGNGLIIENVIASSSQGAVFAPAPSYPKREIGSIDSYEPSALGGLNLDSAIAAQVDDLWAAPYYLNGTGMKIGVVDGGSVRDTHVELRNRVTNLSSSDTNLHATHVTGTLISAGTHLPTSRGFANEAEVYSLDYNDVNFAESVTKLANNYGVLLSNHSYGYQGSDGLGEYDSTSRDLDEAIHDNPYIISVMASGNDGDEYKYNNDFTQWGIIKGGSNAKNVLTVAAIDNQSNKIASFSSAGPIKGGRLKPDIAADGVNVLSTSNWDDTAYIRREGTSMASPAVTGAVALLSQRYKQINGANPRVDTIKAILFNTAVDIENTGPDFKSGFGHLDALEAVKTIDTMAFRDNSLVKLETITEGENQRYYLSATGYENFKVTLAWVDDIYSSCSSCANDILMSDIDMVLVEESSGKKIYPYTLSENNPSADAVQTAQNHIDPQEQIAYRLKPGNYRLEVSSSKISSSSQNFTLVSSKPLSDVEKDIVMTPLSTHIHKMYDATK